MPFTIDLTNPAYVTHTTTSALVVRAIPLINIAISNNNILDSSVIGTLVGTMSANFVSLTTTFVSGGSSAGLSNVLHRNTAFSSITGAGLANVLHNNTISVFVSGTSSAGLANVLHNNTASAFVSGATSAGLANVLHNNTAFSSISSAGLANNPSISYAPSYAQTAGFNILTFSDDFTTTSTIATSGAPTSGFNWYWDSNGITSTADYSVNTAEVPGVTDGFATAPGRSTGILTINTSHANSFSAGLKTTFRTQLGSNTAGGFQHGLIEAYIYVNQVVQGGGGPNSATQAWPAFWLWDTRALTPINGHLTAECDIMEWFPAGTAGASSSLITTMHNWLNSSGAATSADDFNNNFPNNVPAAGNPVAGWHKYGCLWKGNGTTGTVSFYIDDVIQTYPTTTVNPTGTAFILDTGASPTAGFSAMESAFMSIILGTGITWPIRIDYVRVWQAYGDIDGSSNAPTGSIQHASLLSGYSKRPNWKVAGVDYYAGVPSTATLTDWQSISLPGSTVNTGSSYVRFDSTNNIVLNNIDFSLHNGAYVFFVTCSNITITNCKFGGSNYAVNVTNAIITLDANSPTLTVKNCTIDGGGPGNGAQCISAGGGGLTTVQYNWIKNFPSQPLNQGSPTVSASLIYQYNMMEQGALEIGAHLNFLQYTGSAVNTSALVSFNTIYQSPQVANGEGFQFYNNGSGAINNVSCMNNTMIAGGISGGDSISYFIHGGGAQNSGVLSNNYMDVSGAFGPFYGGSFTGWTLSQNYNMVSGAAFTTTP